MHSIFSSFYKTEDYVPVVHAYYDRADMIHTTKEEMSHAHTLCEVMYVNEGALSLTVEGQDVRIGRKQFIWLDATVFHQPLRFDASMGLCSIMNIEYQYELLDKRCPTTRGMYESSEAFRYMLDHPVPYLVLTDADDTIYGLIKQIILLADSAHAQAERLCSFLCAQVNLFIARRRLLSLETASAPIHNQYVASALNIIGECCTESITIQQMADRLHIHPTHLHRLFKEHMGMTLGDYIHHVRIKKAQDLLTNTRGTLRDISTAVGIGSQQYFVQLFKRIVGMSPTEYRRKYQGGTMGKTFKEPLNQHQ